jgi:hypothetical protein
VERCEPVQEKKKRVQIGCGETGKGEEKKIKVHDNTTDRNGESHSFFFLHAFDMDIHDDVGVLQQERPMMDLEAEVVTRFVCCACGDELASDNFFRLEKTEDTSPAAYFCDGYWCVLTIDESLFGISPHLCFKCESSNRHKQRTTTAAPITCDICGALAQSGRYKLRRTAGKLFVGTHKCLIFDGGIVSGYACGACYQRNRAHARRIGDDAADADKLDGEMYGDDRDDVPLRKRRCLKATYDNSTAITNELLSSSPVAAAAIDTARPDSQLLLESLPTTGTSTLTSDATLQLEHDSISSPVDDDADVAGIVKRIVSIEEARVSTVTMISTVGSFLSRRRNVTVALAGVSDNAFVADDFVSMQTHFLEMLKSQLSLIKADQKRCADQLSDANK